MTDEEQQYIDSVGKSTESVLAILRDHFECDDLPRYITYVAAELSIEALSVAQRHGQDLKHIKSCMSSVLQHALGEID